MGNNLNWYCAKHRREWQGSAYSQCDSCAAEALDPGFNYHSSSSVPKAPPSGIKHDSGKPPFSLITNECLTLMAQALQYGANKYTPDNYKLGMAHRRIIDAVLRHLYAYSSGENLDIESTVSHIGHALAGLNMLAYNIAHHPSLDDRFKEPNESGNK